MNLPKPRGLKDMLEPPLGVSGRNSRLMHPVVAGPLSGPACCCDVADLCQAFSQPTGLGR
jgi:hypothetical protein